jgi:predicted small secreted protein
MKATTVWAAFCLALTGCSTVGSLGEDMGQPSAHLQDKAVEAHEFFTPSHSTDVDGFRETLAYP